MANRHLLLSNLQIERMMRALPRESGATIKQCPYPGKLIILTGPSGVGKGSLMRSLLQRHPELYYSVSVTTRSPRPGEVDGKEYIFITPSKFQQLAAKGDLLEWAQFAGNYYGTPREPVEQQIREGKSVVLEIELEGARQIRAAFPATLSIFILPPSFKELEKRIRGRAKDSEEAISLRLHRAEEEIHAADEFDIQIVNDDFEDALNSIEAALFG